MALVPVLEANEARVAVDGVVAIDRLTLATRGDRVLFAGDPGPLFAALTSVPLAEKGARAAALDEERPGEADVVAGTLLLAGRSVPRGEHVPIMGAAPLDPPLPPGWTVEEYVRWGARLTGASEGTAKALALAALARVDLQGARKKALSSLAPHERRALSLAQAIVASPEVIVAEAPLSGLAGAEAAFVRSALAAVIEGRRAILSATRLDPASPEGELARAASHLVVMAGGEVVLEGPPAELFSGARVVSLAVRKGAAELRALLAARGIDLRGGPVRFSATLPPGATTREILAAAKEARAAVVEMVPVIG